MVSCGPEVFGSDPAHIKWSIVRGDTSTIRVDFLQNDEKTHYDISGWSFVASAYDPKTDIIDELTVESFDGYVVISAPTEITSLWGTLYSGTVAELNFDLEVTFEDNTVWTPIVGTISVIADISGGL